MRKMMTFYSLMVLLATAGTSLAQVSRYRSLLATTAGRDSLSRIALWEDGRVTGNGRLFRYLSSDNPLIRARGVQAIGRIQDAQDVPRLIPLLKDPDPSVVRAAVFALGQIGSEDASPALVDLNKKASPELQPLVCEALGKIGGNEAVTELMETLHAFQGSVRAAAAISLSKVEDPSAINALLVSIHDSDTQVAWRAIYSLEKARSDRVRDAVIPFLQSEDPEVKAYAARTLGKQKAEDAAGPIGTNVADPDIRVTINSINALAAILEDSDNKSVVNHRAAKTESAESHHVRKASVIAIGSIGHKDGKDYLAQTILDSYPGIRGESYLALAKILGKNSLVFINSGLQDSDPLVRVAATEAIGLAGEKKRIPQLVSIAQDNDDPRIRAAAVRALANFDRDDTRAELIARLSDEDWVVATVSVAALGEVGNDESMPALIERFSARDDRLDNDLRIEVMRVMTQKKVEEGLAIARVALDDSDVRLRRAAVEYYEAMAIPTPEIKPDRFFWERDFDSSRKAELSLPLGTRHAVIRTERGDIEIELFGDDATQTVATFMRLVESGFYDGLNFHRVVPNFVIQGGCPRGDGWGDPGFNIRSEFNQYRYERGMVGIAHAGKDTGGCQFFITHSAQPHLNGRYTIFGKVTNGMNVVDEIAQGDRFNIVIVE